MYAISPIFEGIFLDAVKKNYTYIDNIFLQITSAHG